MHYLRKYPRNGRMRLHLLQLLLRRLPHLIRATRTTWKACLIR